jgi:hypothetical protein
MNRNAWMPEGSRTLFHGEEPEFRVASCWTAIDGSLVVSEVTRGQTTRQTYGTGHHMHRVAIAPRNEAALAQALGCRRGGEVERLAELFSGGDVFLSDLMDTLDAHDVVYAYTSRHGDGPISWRPAQESRDGCGAIRGGDGSLDGRARGRRS